MNDRELLREFVEQRSEEAFRTLVTNHLPLVFGTARRITGDAALAEEVAQTVFILLVRKAWTLKRGVVLAGWLYRSTRFVAARAPRNEQRRRRREQLAVNMQETPDPNPSWSRVVPELDPSLARLSEADRNILLLRYIEDRPLREVGTTLGLTEEAAKKRVGRALEKLRRILRRKGVEISVSALMAGLGSEAAQSAAAAPGLAGQISASALADLSAGAGMPTAGSALLTEALGALWWAKLRMIVGVSAGLATLALLIPLAVQMMRQAPQAASSARQSAIVEPSNNATMRNRAGQRAVNRRQTLEFNGMIIPLRTLDLTVLDSVTKQPIEGAVVSHFLTHWPPGKTGNPERTGSNGTVAILVPKTVPGLERMDQYPVEVRASNYAPRGVLWLSTTGGVLSMVSTQYTLGLEHGITLGGAVLDLIFAPEIRA
jgi:RNA polymerase sigma factor (sigma-70 family)